MVADIAVQVEKNYRISIESHFCVVLEISYISLSYLFLLFSLKMTATLYPEISMRMEYFHGKV